MLGKIKDGVLVNNYTPHQAQQAIHFDTARFRICVCGRRFGKTTFALNELYMQGWSNQDPLARCWYVAPNYRQAKTVAWEMLKETVPEQVIEQINEAELSIRLKNRSLIELKGADSQDSLRGAKLKFVVLDEYASMRPTVWDEVIRPSMADVKGSKALFIGTPSGFNHFKVLYDRGLGQDPEYKSFRFRTLDNPHVEEKEIEEIRKKTNPAIFRQEYEASFEQMSGSIFPMFKRETHVIKPREIPEEWDHVCAMDWGMRNATAALFAVISPSGEVIVYDMVYQPGKTVSQWAEVFKNRFDFERISSWIIDPAAIAQAKEFGPYGIFFHSYNPETTKKINDVSIGINLVSQYLLEGKIKIFDHCETLIQEMEQYQWEPPSSRSLSDAKPRPLKKDDHSVDALRYLVMTRPQGKEIKKAKYKNLDPASEMFWRSHYNEVPDQAKILYPRESLLFGIDEGYATDDTRDLW